MTAAAGWVERKIVAQRRRLASTLRLALYLAVPTAPLYLLGWPRLAATLALLAAFFLVVSLLEWVTLRRLQTPGQRTPSAVRVEATEGFELVESDGDAWLENRALTENGVVVVQVPDEGYEPMLAHAQRLVDEASEVVPRLLDLFRHEDRDMPSPTAGDLGWVCVAFYNPSKADTGEVWFGPQMEEVTCLYRDGSFYALTFES